MNKATEKLQKKLKKAQSKGDDARIAKLQKRLAKHEVGQANHTTAELRARHG